MVQWLRRHLHCKGHKCDPWLGKQDPVCHGMARKTPNKQKKHQATCIFSNYSFAWVYAHRIAESHDNSSCSFLRNLHTEFHKMDALIYIPTKSVGGFPFLHTLSNIHYLQTLKKFFWPHYVACEVLVPWLGMKPVFPVVEAGSLNHWTTREIPYYLQTF